MDAIEDARVAIEYDELAAEVARKNELLRTAYVERDLLADEVERLRADLARGEQTTLFGIRVEADASAASGTIDVYEKDERKLRLVLDGGDGPPRHRVESFAQILAGFSWPGRGGWQRLSNTQREAALDGAKRALARCLGVE